MDHLLPYCRQVARVRDNRSALVALLAAMLLLSLPPSSPAAGPEGNGEPAANLGARAQATGSSAPDLLVRGTGYGLPNGSRDVRKLQRSLGALGHDPGPIDGLYGPRTEGAVERFQLAHGLAADGVAGPHTWTALYQGHGGSQPVRKLQRELRKLGHDPGPIDGQYGPRTGGAVERFQRAQGLAADGVVGPETRRLLVARVHEWQVDRADKPTGEGALEHRAPISAGAGVVPAAPAAAPAISPGYVALLGALALALALVLVARWSLRGRLRIRMQGDSVPPARARVPNAGMALAFLFGVFVIGAACGALFASEAAPDRRAELRVEPLRLGFETPPTKPSAP
jgi:hypothetical protein